MPRIAREYSTFAAKRYAHVIKYILVHISSEEVNLVAKAKQSF